MTDEQMPPDPFPPARLRPKLVDGACELAVEVIPLNLDAPDTAIWCEACLLPSAIGYRFRILVNGVALDRPALTLNACRDCGSTWRTT